MSFLLVSRGSRVDFKKWESLHQPDFKRDPNLGGFRNAALRLCQPNVSRDVKKYIVGAEVGKSHRSSHKETLRLQTATTEMWLRRRPDLEIQRDRSPTESLRANPGRIPGKSTSLVVN